MKQAMKDAGRGLAAPVGRALAAIGVSANLLTVLGVMFAALAFYGFVAGDRALAFIGLVLSGLADLLDGAVARAHGGGGTKFGAALDSTLDRYGEGLVFGGILLGLSKRGADEWLLVLAVVAGVGAYLVSYARARAEGLGVSAEVGIMERPERIALLLVLALWGDAGAPWILGVLTLFTHITFVQRLLCVRAASSAEGSSPPRERAG